MRLRAVVACVTVTTGLAIPVTSEATPASGLMTGANGDGTYDATLRCGPGVGGNGDGPSWRYFWLDQAASSPGGLLLGTWDGSFEVHDAEHVDGTNAGKAFVPDGDGRLSVTVNRGGTGFFDTLGGAGCANPNLTLTTQPDGDPEVHGSLPIVARGGTGAMRGLTGTGTISFGLELGAGADNVATIAVSANLDVADPQLSIVGASSRWQNLSAYLGRRLTVYVTVANAPGAGDAFDVQITSVTGGTGSFGGTPTGTAKIPAGGSATFGLTMNLASPNKAYSITATAAGKDGLLAGVPPAPGGASFTSPLLP